MIFYRTKRVKGTRFSRMFLKAAAERKRKAEAAVLFRHRNAQPAKVDHFLPNLGIDAVALSNGRD